MKKTWQETIFFFIAGTALVWSLGAGIIGNTEFLTEPGTIFFRSVIVLIILKLIFFNMYTLLFTVGVAFMAAGILFWDLHFGEYPVLQDINLFTLELLLYINGLIPFSPPFGNFLSWAIISALGLFVTIFGYIRFNFALLAAVGMGIFAIILASGLFYFGLSFYVFVFAILAYLTKHLNINSLKAHYSPFVLYVVPIVLLSLTMAYFIPTPREGFSEEVADNILTRPLNFVNETLNDIFRPKYFSLAQTGFGTGNIRRLGGDVTANYNIVMRLRTEEVNLYLTGAVLDEYTGYSWINNFEIEPLDFSEINLPLLEQKATFINRWVLGDYTVDSFIDTYIDIPVEDLWYYTRALGFTGFVTPQYYPFRNMAFRQSYLTVPFIERQLMVDTLGNSTFSVFHTGILTGIEFNIPGINPYQNFNGTITTNYLMPRNNIYTVTYRTIREGVQINRLLATSYTGMLADVLENIEYDDDFYIWGFGSYRELLENYLIPRAAEIAEIYTSLPDHLPQRIINLAEEITGNALNNYEKARMLEIYLRQFEYTLTPGHFPQGRDFVDYFLFDSMRGYCTYYASAFVVMARALGLPARYVEGFIAFGDPTGYTYIRNRQGHAWAEVHFEGFGWVRFEPTPPSDTFGALFVTSPPPALEGMEWYDIGMMWWEEDYYLIAAIGRTPPVAYMEGDLELLEVVHTDITTAVPVDISGILRQALTLTLTLIIIAFLGRIVYVLYCRYRIKRLSNQEAVKYYFENLLKYLKFFNYEKSNNETALEYGQRLDKRFGFENEKVFVKDLANIFLKAKYSLHPISSEERQIFINALNLLDRRMKSYISLPRYVLMKYVKAEV